jgi:hypothetical protein
MKIYLINNKQQTSISPSFGGVRGGQDYGN